MRNRFRDPRRLRAGCLAVLATCGVTAAAAAQAPLPSHWEPFRLSSGNHQNPTPVSGVAVWKQMVTLPATVPWLRLYLSRAHLGKGSFLRITSLRDGDVQTMQQEHLEQWEYRTAFFNGNAVLVEIVAGPHTAKNFIEIDKIRAGDDPATVHVIRSICGSTDDRLPSFNPAVGRMLGTNFCTGWIINEPSGGTDRCHLSAGHCFAGAGDVIQFSVPSSNADCSFVHPPASLQFAIDRASAIWVNGGIGNDYMVFRCFRNPNTNLTTFQQQGAAITLASVNPPANTQLRVTGYGTDGTSTNNASGGNASCSCVAGNRTGSRNGTQQTSDGPLAAIAGNDALIDVDLCGGNSGGPVFRDSNNEGVAIATHHGCVGGSNHATLVTHPGIRNAILQVCGAPANDDCLSAIPVVDGINGPYTNNTATNSTPAWPCGSGGNDVWFTYVATCLGSVTIDTCSAATNFDTVLQVFAGGCGALVSAACNDDACGTNNRSSRVTFVTSINARYYIRVGGYNGARGSFTLSISGCTTADECLGGIPIGLGANGPFSNATATTSPPVWPCGSGGSDLWFRYVSPCAEVVTFSTCSTLTDFDTVLQVFTGAGACNSLLNVGCNDDDPTCGGNNRASRVQVTTRGVTSFFIRVGGFNSARGRFTLNVSVQPVNDECANAIAVSDGLNGRFCTIGATTTASPPFCDPTAGSDVWFRYVAPCDGLLLVDTCAPSRDFDTVLEVLSGSCARMTSIGCNDDACGVGSSVAAPVLANREYYIRVGGASSEAGSFDLRVRCSAINDECSNAAAVTLGVNGPFSNRFATTSPPAWTLCNGANDVWFRYQAGCTAPHTFRTCSAARTFDTVLEVFRGDCNGLTFLRCNDDACALGSSVTVDLAAGSVYHVRVGGYNGAQGAFDLEVLQGSGTGRIGSVPTGCGATTLSASGNPNIGGSVSFQMSGVAGVPVIVLGFSALNAPLCPPAPCMLGPSPQVSIPAATYTLPLPCGSQYIGARIYIQGADVLAPGGCTGLNLRVTDTVVVDVG